jgi:hypothetical protein
VRAPGLARREAAGLAALGVSLLAFGLAVLAATGRTISFDVGSLHVSLRHARNPALAAVVFGALAVWQLGARRVGAVGDALNLHLARWSPLLAIVLAIAVMLAAWRNGALVAGSADSSGYLSQARAWAERGSVRIRPQPVGEIRFVHGLRAIAPLGWTPAAGGADLVPVYPPGLPWLMAGFRRIAGAGAEFWVVPVAGALLVWTTFVLGRLIGGSITGLLAALGVAVSPTFLFQVLQPMSDVPAAAAWVGAATLLAMPSATLASGASAAGVVACLIRPNLFAMVPVLAVGAWWWEPATRRGLLRAVAIAVPAILVALASAWWQRILYGGSTTTGYGDFGTLFSWKHLGPNLVSFASWLYETHGVFLLPAVAAPVVLARGALSPRLARERAVAVAWWCLAMWTALFCFYLLYLPFENWPYARFLLPALPLVIALSATAVLAAVNRLPPGLRTLGLVALLILLPSVAVSRARDLAVFGIGQSEQRYVAAAEFVVTQPSDAVFLSMVHSGSIAYYSGRSILRWDWLEPDEIDAAIDDLTATGHAIFAVLDDWEVADLLARHKGTALARRLHTPVVEFRPNDAIATSIFSVSAPIGR